MNQSQLDRSVARATGETVATIRHMGFSEVHMPQSHFYRPKANAQCLQLPRRAMPQSNKLKAA